MPLPPGGQPELQGQPADAVLVLLRLRAQRRRLHLRRADREDRQARRPPDAGGAGGRRAQEAEPGAEGALRLAQAPARDAQARGPVLRVRAVVDPGGRGRAGACWRSAQVGEETARRFQLGYAPGRPRLRRVPAREEALARRRAGGRPHAPRRHRLLRRAPGHPDPRRARPAAGVHRPDGPAGRAAQVHQLARNARIHKRKRDLRPRPGPGRDRASAATRC